VDVTIGERNFSVEEAAQVQWAGGTWVAGDRSPIVGLPQLLNPTPAIVANVQFRRALLHAVDRQEMADTFMAGQGEVAHAYASPSNKEYADVQGAAVRYEFDPRRATQLVESLGYTRGQDGFFSDRSGAKPSVEVRTTTTTENQKTALSIADYWQRAGVITEPHIVPLARTQEAEYRATFPGFEVIRQPGVDVMTRVHSSRARLPENNFRGIGGGFNYTRYMNPEHDALVDRYLMTVPWPERMDVLRQLVRHLTDQVIIMGMFYSTEANLLSNRLENVHPTRSWAAHEWSVK
jgi:peptide/nickel transport system substrate-binding protein